MTKRNKVIGLVLSIWVIAGAVCGTIQSVQQHRVSTEVEAARNEAASVTAKDTSFQFARHWLEQHRYRVIVADRSIPDGDVWYQTADDAPGPELGNLDRVIIGERLVQPESWLRVEVWVRATFNFTPLGRFRGVSVEKVSTPWPVDRRPATRPAA